MQQVKSNEAISFEVPIDKLADGVAANPPIKQRLEQRIALEEPVLTLEQIESKLVEAAQRKAMALQNQISRTREESDRVCLIQERKSSAERAQVTQIHQKVEKKQSNAQQNRILQLDGRRARAREFNDRVNLAKERRSSQERFSGEKDSESLSVKLIKAEERICKQTEEKLEKVRAKNQRVEEMRMSRQAESEREAKAKLALIEEKLNKAKEAREAKELKAKLHNEKVQETVEKVTQEQIMTQEKNQAALEEKLSTMQEKLTKAKQLVEAQMLKAKAHNEKVQEAVEKMSQEQLLQKEKSSQALQEKLQSAASRREEKIEMVKQAAAQSAALLSGSPKKQ